jgi:nudix-type nucleoside diphosphatase (YffH/AdpP family)
MIIKSRKRIFSGFFELEEWKLQADGQEITRTMVIPKPAAAILLYNKEEDKVILISQFRAAAVVRESGDKGRNKDKENGWLLEIPAGVASDGEPTKSCAIRESFEETGYKISDCELIYSCYVSPGYSTEKIDIYFTEVKSADKVGRGGGLKDEHEMIKLFEIPFSEALQMLKEGKIIDAKTIIALQWLAGFRV